MRSAKATASRPHGIERVVGECASEVAQPIARGTREIARGIVGVRHHHRCVSGGQHRETTIEHDVIERPTGSSDGDATPGSQATGSDGVHGYEVSALARTLNLRISRAALLMRLWL